MGSPALNFDAKSAASAAVEISGLYSGYGRTQILHGVDFEAEKSTITAVIGANGSGKSTLLKSIFGLCDIRSGSIAVFGKSTMNTPTHKMSRHGVAYMAQRQNVFSDLTVRENLIIAADGRSIEDTFTAFPELNPFRTRVAGTLSGGQRQLLAIAMILLRDPEVVLYDEPTAALSPKNAQLILDKIKQINMEQRNCTIIVEQNVRRALEFCDTVYMLASGKVAYSGPPSRLLEDKDLAAKYLGV